LGIKGHWDEELHGLDYLVYAYLQKGDNDSARMQLKYLRTIVKVSPTNFKVAYAFAAIPSRYVLENKLWKEAANLELYPADLDWKDFPWQEAIIHFARMLGATNSGDLSLAKKELRELNRLHDTLINQKDSYKANQVAIQIKTGEAWIKLKEGKSNEAIAVMQLAADMEDSTSKHPVTPGEVRPARELYADMLLQVKQTDKALQAYETVLQKSPNRFNSLYGAAVASQRMGDFKKAGLYYQQLITISDLRSERSELLNAVDFLKAH
jgi:tetratricopeptide (TPR) repeat protein